MEITHQGHRVPRYSYPDMEFMELRTPTNITPVTYFIFAQYVMFSIGIAIVPRDYMNQRSPNPYEEWPLLLQFGSHLDVEGINWEPAPDPPSGHLSKSDRIFRSITLVIADQQLQ